MSVVKAMEMEIPGGRIEGTCDTRFLAVAEAFKQNFERNGEVGASVCVTENGRTVVDLWGGSANPSAGIAWEKDTLAPVMSCTKGATALSAHILASRGQLDLEAPVGEYWPEFAVNGKEKATVRMMLDHSVGVPALRAPVPKGAACHWDDMVGRLQAEEPFWEPGTRNGYHMLTFGWLVGELVRRVSGRSLGQFFRQEVAEPLGIEFWIGAPEATDSRFAQCLMWQPKPGDTFNTFARKLASDPKSLQFLATLNLGGFDPNRTEYRRAEIPGGGGITNARGLAGMYAPLACGGVLDGHELLKPGQVEKMGAVAVATNQDATLLLPTRFSLGFMKSMDNRDRRRDRDSAIFGEPAFGHVGAGGSIGFADPQHGLSVGYVMNKLGGGILLNERGQSLVDAVYHSIGGGSNGIEG